RDSAFHDSRFSPLTEAELNDVVIDITILEPPVDVSGWKDIVVGKHGVILKQGFASAVFLPQVAPEQGWDRETMLSHLARKAGLPADAWKEGASFLVFQAVVFGEEK
ncbi:MAG: AmmeMemoRadiSam system protein A, partial [Planctomycetota bacterium]|nr:AmmeMemoRadiSam system protein A [Planctomycetota bacterium]